MFEDHTPNHPDSSVRAICQRPGSGHVITMGFPGLDSDYRGRSLINPERLTATLTHAVDADLQLLLILARPEELPPAAMAYVREALCIRGMRAIALPIEDYSVPTPAFMRAWSRLSPAFETVFASGGAIGMSCHHGAGRSGLVAAMHLVDAGQAPADAVSMLRSQFPETVENEHQYGWLIDYAKTRHQE